MTLCCACAAHLSFVAKRMLAMNGVLQLGHMCSCKPLCMQHIASTIGLGIIKLRKQQGRRGRTFLCHVDGRQLLGNWTAQNDLPASLHSHTSKSGHCEERFGDTEDAGCTSLSRPSANRHQKEMKSACR